MEAATAYWHGLGMGASLIIAIGAQNAFVLTQSIQRNHAWSVAGLCALIDVLLISAGVCGVGTLVAQNALLKAIASLGGAAFLIWFGARSLIAAFQLQTLTATESATKPFGPTIAATFAISLLNPHVYLDTVIMLGAISGNYADTGRYVFGAGACTASVLWFSTLCIAGAYLAPIFKNPKAWQYLNGLVCAMVWWVAAGLLYSFFTG